jgi:hypothetical protein
MRGIMFAAILLACASVAPGQDNSGGPYPHWEVYAAYTQLRTSYDFFPLVGDVKLTDDLNTNRGFEAAVIRSLNRFVGIKGDFSANFSSDGFNVNAAMPCGQPPCPGTLQPGTLNSKVYAFLAGPELSWHNHTRFTPFIHALYGAGHVDAAFKTSGPALDLTVLTYQTGFEMAYGGGLDLCITRRITLRYSADYGSAFMGKNASGGTQRVETVRSSVGVLFRP